MNALLLLLSGLLSAFVATVLLAPSVLTGLLLGAFVLVAVAFVALGVARIRRVITMALSTGAPAMIRPGTPAGATDNQSAASAGSMSPQSRAA